MGRFRVAVPLLLTPLSAVANPQMTRAINDLRTANDLEPLQFSTALEAAAAHHAKDMAQAGMFSHTGSDGSNVGSRITDAGYGWCVAAENIAQGQRDLAEVMKAWADSPGHRRNMLSPEVTEFAVVEGANYIWVMVLAAPGC